MPLSVETLRLLIGLTLVGMALLGGLYLRGRTMSRWEWVGWILLLLFVPLLGPFLVILSGPGRPRKLGL
jgi:hypothetical protein